MSRLGEAQEQVRAERRLSTQYAVSRALAEAESLDDAAPHILKAIGEGFDWELGQLWLVDQPAGVVRYRNSWSTDSFPAREFIAQNRHLTFAQGVGLPGRVWQSCEPVWVADFAQSPGLLRAQLADEHGFHSAFAFPVLGESGVLAVIEFFSHRIQRPGLRLLESVSMLGSQMGQFMEKKLAQEQLEEQVEERTSELATLLDVSQHVTPTLQLQPLADLVLDQLKVMVDYVGAGIIVQEGEDGNVFCRRRPGPQETRLRRRDPVPAAAPTPDPGSWTEPLIVDDVHGDSAPASFLREVMGDELSTSLSIVHSYLAVPMRIKDRVLGYLYLVHSEPSFYSEHHARLAMAIGRHAAIAVENATLYAQAQELAAMEERQRLSRELHDSVIQALYGITLHATAGSRLLASGDHGAASRQLREVGNTAQDALREMRLLIFQLRPPILEQDGLVAALEARLAAVEGRTANLTTRVDMQPNLRLPLPTEVALYRIAQETLNNVLKHARAHTVSLSLREEEGRVRLVVIDDGTGFDPAHLTHSGGFGLTGMAERAADVGGILTMRSAPGRGTAVTVELEP